MPDMMHPPHASPLQKAVEISAPDATLRGTLFSPIDQPPKRAILINAATGVRASFYKHFAQWLSNSQQAAVLTWDYRDFGASGQPYGSQASMTDWGVHDPFAARGWMRESHPDLPLWVIGHSLGAMALPFQPDLHQIDRVIAIAAGPGHVSQHPWPFRAQAWALWHLAGPLATSFLDHLPGRRLGLGNDLPIPVFRQWKRWCIDRGSLPADPDLPAPETPGLTCPATLIALDDDVMIPPTSVWRLADWMPSARTETRLLRPADHGLKTVGHIAAFAPRNRALWPLIMA